MYVEPKKHTGVANTRNSDFATKENAILERAEQLKNWLKKNSPDCEDQQLHLDEGSQERTYWHYGYLIALQDVLALLSNKKQSLH